MVMVVQVRQGIGFDTLRERKHVPVCKVSNEDQDGTECHCEEGFPEFADIWRGSNQDEQQPAQALNKDSDD